MNLLDQIYSISMSSKQVTSLADFQIISKLGEGAFAEVYKVKRKEDGLYYAMKKISMSKIKEKDRNNALNEVRILASEGAGNIIQYKEAFFDEITATLCIVMQYAQGGDLLALIRAHGKKNIKVREQQIWKAMAHIARGLKSLHDKNILHRDLKAANIFITADGQYKIGDMNVSKVVKHDMAKTQTGTPYYASPEVWKDLPYGSKSDMWSLGCVLYQMAAQRPPFTANDLQSLYKKICSGVFPRIPHEYSNDLASVISSLLKLNTNERPSAAALLSNPLLQIHCDDLEGEVVGQRNELLDTIRMKSKNYKQMNELLPKAKYQTELSKQKQQTEQPRQRSYSHEKRGLPNANNLEEKEPQQKKRIKSSFESNSKENIVGKSNRNIICRPSRDRTNSSINASKVRVSQLLGQKLPPLSHHVTKKTPQISNLFNTPKLQNRRPNQISKIPPNNKISTRKIDTLINTPSLSEANKQNLRRLGENLLNRKGCKFVVE